MYVCLCGGSPVRRSPTRSHAARPTAGRSLWRAVRDWTVVAACATSRRSSRLNRPAPFRRRVRHEARRARRRQAGPRRSGRAGEIGHAGAGPPIVRTAAPDSSRLPCQTAGCLSASPEQEELPPCRSLSGMRMSSTRNPGAPLGASRGVAACRCRHHLPDRVFHPSSCRSPGGAPATSWRSSSAVTYVLFVIDYLVRLGLADHRSRWFFQHLIDLAIVALPFLRPLRLFAASGPVQCVAEGGRRRHSRTRHHLHGVQLDSADLCCFVGNSGRRARRRGLGDQELR